MSNTTIRARSLPYREPRPGAYTCGRCGIVRPRTGGQRPTYCADCRGEARILGWTHTTTPERKTA